jgi:hypothetical protein
VKPLPRCHISALSPTVLKIPNMSVSAVIHSQIFKFVVHRGPTYRGLSTTTQVISSSRRVNATTIRYATISPSHVPCSMIRRGQHRDRLTAAHVPVTESIRECFRTQRAEFRENQLRLIAVVRPFGASCSSTR